MDIYFVLLVSCIFLMILGILIIKRKNIRSRFLNRWSNNQVLEEDLLKQIYLSETREEKVSAASLASILGRKENEVQGALDLLIEKELIGWRRDESIFLSSSGRGAAIKVLRAHRLWERFLADETGFPETEWHAQAERIEHKLPITDLDRLSRQLGNPAYDPHGDPIPTAEGELPHEVGRPISELKAGMAARIVHLEDEPEEIYKRLRKHNLSLTSEIYLLEAAGSQFIIWVDGDEIVLKPDELANIFVIPIPSWDFRDRLPGERLSSLRPGETGVVNRISPIIRGQERRRLMDLGIVPGTSIRTEFESPSGEPVAYDIRGALIALRREQTDHIRVHRSAA